MQVDRARAALVVSVLNALSRVSGFVRIVVIAAVYGASWELDAYWVAIAIPSILPSLLSGITTTVFIPYFIKRLSGKRDGADWAGANSFMTLIVLGLLLASMAVAYWAGHLIDWTAPGLDQRTRGLAVQLTRISIAVTVLVGINASLQALAQCTGRFAATAFEGLVTNASTILLALLFHRQLGVWALACGLLAGVVFNGAILLSATYPTLKASFRPQIHWANAGFRKMWLDCLPYTLSYGGTWLSTLVAQAFVSSLDEGSISSLNYASTLAFLPLEVLGMSVITVAYPEICRRLEEGTRAVAEYFSRAAGAMVALMVLPVLATLVLSEKIVAILLQRHNFSASDTKATALALTILSLAVIPRAITYLNFRLLVATERRWVQVLIGLGGVFANVLLTIQLVPHFGLAGACAAVVGAALLTLACSMILVSRTLSQAKSIYGPSMGWRFLLLVAGFLIPSTAVVRVLDGFLEDQGKLTQFAVATLGGIAGLAGFCMAARVARHHGVDDLAARARNWASKGFAKLFRANSGTG